MARRNPRRPLRPTKMEELAPAWQLAWTRRWGPWSSRLMSRLFTASPLVRQLMASGDGPQQLNDPEVAVRVLREMLELSDQVRAQQVKQAVADVEHEHAQQEAQRQHQEASWQEREAGWREREQQLLTQVSLLQDEFAQFVSSRGSRQLAELTEPLAQSEQPEDLRRLWKRLRTVLTTTPTADSWLRALRTMQDSAAEIADGQASPKTLRQPVGAALARSCTIGQVSIALGVPIPTVQRIAPKMQLGLPEVAEVEDRYRAALVHGALAYQALTLQDFTPPPRVLDLKTTSGPDLGVVVRRPPHLRRRK